MLRCLTKSPLWKYELVEIPHAVLERCATGEFEMKQGGALPKSGYCYVYGEDHVLDFKLNFDGAGERKLQIQALRKNLCLVHAEWIFEPTVSGLE